MPTFLKPTLELRGSSLSAAGAFAAGFAITFLFLKAAGRFIFAGIAIDNAALKLSLKADFQSCLGPEPRLFLKCTARTATDYYLYWVFGIWDLLFRGL